MTDDAKNAEKIAALERELAEVKAAVKSPAPDPMADAQALAKWQDEMHQMRERRMSCATPPAVVRDWAVIPDHIVRGVVNDRHAPTGPSSRGTGWAHEVPLSNPPGVNYADRTNRIVVIVPNSPNA